MTDRQSPNLTWRVHLAKEQPSSAALAAGIIALVVLTTGLITHNLFWPTLTLAFLVGSLHDFFFPMTFTVDDHGVEARGLGTHRRLEWERARRCVVAPDGVKVSPFAGPSQLDEFRGVLLRCAGETREQVIATVTAKLAAREGEAPAEPADRDVATASPSRPAVTA